MLADEVDFVVGVDTHADRHALAVVDAATRQTCRQLTVAASRQGYRQALRLARRHAPGRPFGIQGVRLQTALPALARGPLDLEHPLALLVQETSQAGAVTAAPLQRPTTAARRMPPREP